MPIYKPAAIHRDTLAALLRRIGIGELTVPRIKFQVALTRPNYPFNPLPNLSSFGHRIDSFDDLLAINDPEDEENFCFSVAEGTVVTMACGWLWVLVER
jgi:hypothetical protein